MTSHAKTHTVPPVATRWKATCAYDGGDFHGWQSQANAVAVQDVIEAALKKILRSDTRIQGSGRTDTGVHAIAQVFHFDAVWPHKPQRLITALRTRLPHSVQVNSLVHAPAGFHARFNSTGKRYHYRITLGHADPFEHPFCWSIDNPLDFEAILETSRRLVGEHDFAAFSASGGNERETTVRTLRRLEIIRRGRRVRVVLEADGFLYKMARSLVGALVAAGLGRMTPSDIAALLHSKARIPDVKTAPARGLFLERVFYT